MNIEHIQPKEVFHWFAEISAVPRGSHNEKAISDFLVRFAKERSLEVYQDEATSSSKSPGRSATKNPLRLYCRDTWIWSAKKRRIRIMIFLKIRSN